MRKIKTIEVLYELNTNDAPTVVISERVEETDNLDRTETHKRVIHTAQNTNGICVISVN